MIQINNINYLRENFREVREIMKVIESNIDNERFKILETRNGLITLQIYKDNHYQLLHSKYDPTSEAEKFIEQFSEEIDQYQHVFFYGIGLGYHIEAFMKKYKHVTFTLYEPSPEVFFRYISNKDLKKLPLSKLKNLYLEKNKNEIEYFLKEFSSKNNEKVLLVILPSYKQIFREQYKVFASTFKEIVIETKAGLLTNLAFEQRWTINSMMNFSTIIETPNILQDINIEKFKDKPVLLVSAGPSLEDEIENIKYIKDRGLAYVFSVGSAINALIEFGIYPDGAFTYDPKHINQFVFKKLIERGIDTIPLIFGTSVGFETIQNYEGPKIHMITSQDTVTPYYIDMLKSSEGYVNDAASIAVVTLQLLHKLEFNPIILVGQNLSFRENKKFSKGINYTHISTTLDDEQLKSTFKVMSVDGDEVLTDQSFNRMKVQMEQYIQTIDNTVIINTTRKGAHIKGTKFEYLESVIKENLTVPVVDPMWYETEKSFYKKDILIKKQKTMDEQLDELLISIERLSKLLLNFENKIYSMGNKEINNQLDKIDKEFKKYSKNKFYKVFIGPMLRVQYEIASKEIKIVNSERDPVIRGKNIINILARLIYDCKNTIENIYPIYVQIRKKINEL